MKKIFYSVSLIAMSAMMFTACGNANKQANTTEAGADSVAQPQEEWITLFDGTSFDGWRGYNRTDMPTAWTIEDGAIKINGSGRGEAGAEDGVAGQHREGGHHLTRQHAPGGHPHHQERYLQKQRGQQRDHASTRDAGQQGKRRHAGHQQQVEPASLLFLGDAAGDEHGRDHGDQHDLQVGGAEQKRLAGCGCADVGDHHHRPDEQKHAARDQHDAVRAGVVQECDLPRLDPRR